MAAKADMPRALFINKATPKKVGCYNYSALAITTAKFGKNKKICYNL